MSLSSNSGFNLSIISGTVPEMLIEEPIGAILISVPVVSIAAQWDCHEL